MVIVEYKANAPLRFAQWGERGGWWLLAAGYWLQAAGYWLLAAGCWLLAAGYWLLAAPREKSATRWQRRVVFGSGAARS